MCYVQANNIGLSLSPVASWQMVKIAVFTTWLFILPNCCPTLAWSQGGQSCTAQVSTRLSRVFHMVIGTCNRLYWHPASIEESTQNSWLSRPTWTLQTFWVEHFQFSVSTCVVSLCYIKLIKLHWTERWLFRIRSANHHHQTTKLKVVGWAKLKTTSQVQP